MSKEVLQRMFNDKFLEVVRDVDGWVMDHIDSDWSVYLNGLKHFGIKRGGWLRGLFRRDDIKIVDPIEMDQFADMSEYLLPPHQLFKRMSGPHRLIFVPRELAEKMLVLGLP